MLPASPGHCVAAVLDPFTRVLRSAVLLTAALHGCEYAAAQPSPGPTVTDVVEFTRIVYPADADSDQLRSQISPDGTRAFAVTRTAITHTDRNRYEIMLLDIRPDRLIY